MIVTVSQKLFVLGSDSCLGFLFPAGLEISHSPAGLEITHSPAGLEISHSPAGLETTQTPSTGL